MRKLILVFFTLFSAHLANASECYNYHTSIAIKLVIKGNGLYYQLTEKDPNGFSYVRQVNKLVKGIDLNSYKLYGEDEEGFVFADKTGVYNLNKNEQYEGNAAKFYKILGSYEGSKNVNGRLFFVGGKWTYISNMNGRTTKFLLPQLPANIVNIKSWGTGLYVKDDKNVYAIRFDFQDDKKYQIQTLPGLTPNETVYYACLAGLGQDYLADQNTMFSIRPDGMSEDITAQLFALGFNTGFNTMKLIDANIPVWQIGNLMLKKRDGASRTLKNPLTGEDIEVEYAYSTAKLITPSSGRNSYTFFKNNIYPIWDDDFSLPAQVNVNASQLSAVEDNLFRGEDFYYMGNHDNYKLANTNISANAKFFPTVASYTKTLPKALADDKFIYFIGDTYDSNLGDKRNLTSKLVKQLGSFYLFNDSIYDGSKAYRITAAYETLSYLGSFVEVINQCGGEMPGSTPARVIYHHFFKDENSVYYFNDQSNKWQIIQTANQADYLADDYEALQALYKIKDVKGKIKKKVAEDKFISKYGLIGFGTLLVVVLGVSLYRKRNDKS